MRDYIYYLEQAEQCRRSAHRAAAPELRLQWEALAEGWLSLVPERTLGRDLRPTSYEDRRDTLL